MGFGWVTYGFAFSFFVAIACFGQISAHLSPAYCLGLWLLGELDAADFFALSAAELAGAIVGAMLVRVVLGRVSSQDACMPKPLTYALC